MLWFTVWTVLVLATLAGGAWLARDLWRKARALLDELHRAADLVGRLADQADALTAAAAAAPVTHDVLTDPEVHREHLARLRTERAQRRAARALRHEATWSRWRAVSR